MAEHLGDVKEFITYDGKQYHKIIGQEKLIEVVTDNGHGGSKIVLMPTGQYKRISDTIVSVLGAYLDNTENFNEFKNTVENFSKRGTNKTSFQHNYLFINENYYYSINNSTKIRSTPQKIGGVFDSLLHIIKSLGYVNYKPIETEKNGHTCLAITITPKDGQPEMTMYFIPMDDYCYQWDS